MAGGVLAGDVAAQPAPGLSDADAVLLNGKIVTVDPVFRVAGAVAIRDGKFLAVGTRGEIEALAGPRTQRIDFVGRTVLPVAVTRKNMNGVVYGKEQAITREEAIRLYTSSAARFTFSEDRLGSIEPGKLADLVVISDDLLTIPDEGIKTIRALTTMVGGRIVYQH